MAYGMITSGILGAVAGLGEAAIKKVGDINEAELKAKIDAEKEKRIEEAQIRLEDRAAAREQGIYDRNQSQEAINKATEHQNRMDEFAAQERMRQTNKIADEARATEQRNDPNDIEFKVKSQQIEASKQSELASKSTIQSNEISRQLEQKKLDTQNQISDLQNKIRSTTDENESNKLRSELLLLQGKIDKPTIEKMSVDTGKVNPDTNQPIKEDVMVKVDPISGKWETIDVAARLKENRPFTKEEATSIAKAEADADPKIGVRTSNWFSQDNATQYDNYVNKRVIELTNMPKGMLNSKSETGKVETGKVSNTESLIKVSNPVEQKQLDNLFNVIKSGESGGKGVNAGTPKPTADNPNPTASGSFQIIDDNLRSHGIKPELPNGKYSNAQKDAFAPTYYKEVYEGVNGNQAAIVAAGFGQEDVYQAIKKAKSKGSNNWWDYLDPNGGVKENMPTIKNRIKQQNKYLFKNDIPIPFAISDFLLNNQ